MIDIQRYVFKKGSVFDTEDGIYLIGDCLTDVLNEYEKAIEELKAEVERLQRVLSGLNEQKSSDAQRSWDKYKPTPNSYGLDDNY